MVSVQKINMKKKTAACTLRLYNRVPMKYLWHTYIENTFLLHCIPSIAVFYTMQVQKNITMRPRL